MFGGVADAHNIHAGWRRALYAISTMNTLRVVDQDGFDDLMDVFETIPSNVDVRPLFGMLAEKCNPQ